VTKCGQNKQPKCFGPLSLLQYFFKNAHVVANIVFMWTIQR